MPKSVYITTIYFSNSSSRRPVQVFFNLNRAKQFVDAQPKDGWHWEIEEAPLEHLNNLQWLEYVSS